MEKFFKSVRFKILITVIAVLLGVMIYSASTGGLASAPEKALSLIASPFQKLSGYISNKTGDTFGKYFHIDEIIEENEKLKAEVDTLRENAIENEELKTENEQLRTMLGVKSINEDYQFVNASIVGRDKYEYFTINKGSLHGVSKNDPIITSSGLVGVVQTVYPTISEVRTVLSTQIDIGAIEPTSNQIGVITGDIELAELGYCKMTYLTDSTLNSGDTIVTSGSSGIYPKNLAIGRVVSVEQSKNGASYYAVIEPFNDIKNITDVFVLTDFLGQSEDTE